ncbi:hypothetical protein ACMHYB_11250 [Sorangium sp. So ce1128]
MPRSSLRAAPVCLATALVLQSATAHADVVLDWNRVTVQATKTAGRSTNAQSRDLALVHLAVHDAVAAIVPRYQAYSSHAVAAGPASADAAAAAAAHAVLKQLFPAQAEALDDALSFSLQGIPDGGR